MRNKERKKLNEAPFKETPIKELTEEAVDSSSSFKWERVCGRGPKQFNWVADNIDAEIIKKIATKRNWDFTKRTTKDGREVWIFGGSFNPFALYDPTNKWLYVQDAKTKAKFHESIEYLEDDSFDESFDWSVFGKYAPLREEAKDPSTFAKGLDFSEFTDELVDWWHQAAAEYLGSNDKSAIEDLMSFVGDIDADEAEKKLYKLYEKGQLAKGDIFSAFEKVFDQASERQEGAEDSSDDDWDSQVEAEWNSRNKWGDLPRGQVQGEVAYDYLETHHKKAVSDYVRTVGRAPESYSDEEISEARKNPDAFIKQVIKSTLLPFEEYFQQRFPTIFNEKYWADWAYFYSKKLLGWDLTNKRGEYFESIRNSLDPWEHTIKDPLLTYMSSREQTSFYKKLKTAVFGRKQQKRK